MLTLHIGGNLVVSSHLKNEGQLWVESSKRHGPIVILHISCKKKVYVIVYHHSYRKKRKKNRKMKDVQEVILFQPIILPETFISFWQLSYCHIAQQTIYSPIQCGHLILHITKYFTKCHS
jgi:hypothetical protein